VLRLFNTLTRRVEPFVPLIEGEVRMYTCGPTVYRPVHLGNLRSYLLADWLRRTFEFDGRRVIQVKNITDVGHMRQDAVDRGEDKVIAAALAAGKTPMEIAAMYERQFLKDESDLGILPATVYPRATEHVPEMVAMIERLVARGLAYDIGGTVYYAVKRFPGYGRLSGNVQEALRQGVRADLLYGRDVHQRQDGAVGRRHLAGEVVGTLSRASTSPASRARMAMHLVPPSSTPA